MTTQELGAVADRVVGDVGPEEPYLQEPVVALEITALVKARDTGGLRRFLNELEHGASVWRVDPWRLTAELGELLIRRQAGPG